MPSARLNWLTLSYFLVVGGYGTLEELLEVITWAQLGIHDKPVSLLMLIITLFSIYELMVYVYVYIKLVY